MFDTYKRYKFKKTNFILGSLICSLILLGSLDLIKDLKINSLFDLKYRDYFFLFSVPLLSGAIGFLILEIIRKKDDFFILESDSILFRQNGKTKTIFLKDVLKIKVENLEKQKRKQTIYVTTSKEEIELCVRYFGFGVDDLIKKIKEQPKSKEIKIERI